MEEIRSSGSVHVAFREAMVKRVLALERSCGFPERLPISWHDYQIEANKEAADHPGLKQAVVDVGSGWEIYLSEAWKESMTEMFGSGWKKDQVRLPKPGSRTGCSPRSGGGVWRSRWVGVEGSPAGARYQRILYPPGAPACMVASRYRAFCTLVKGPACMAAGTARP